MRLPAFLARWLDVLAALLLAWHEMWRARRSLLIRQVNGRWVMRAPGATQDSVLADDPDSVPRAARVAHGSFVVYELPEHQVVVRRVDIPAQARDFLPGIVRNQIDRLSPWQVNQALYGFVVQSAPKDAATLEVRVLITSRSIIE